jgi:uncharacterized protein involved in outer membrane biogenesis
MRKKIISGLIIAIGALLILALLNVNLLVERNKTYLLAKAEQSLGLKISPDRIEVTLWPLGARLVDVIVSADPALSTDDLLRAKAIEIDLQFLPLLMGRLRPRKIVLDAPAMTIVRDESGRYNFASSPQHGKNHGNSGISDREPSAEKQDRPSFFIVTPLKISNGTLRYRDLRTGREVTATQINFKVDGAGLDEALEVELEAALMSANTNMKLKATVGPVAAAQDYRDVPIDGKIQVEALDMGRINAAMPQFKKALPQALQFDGIYSTKELIFKGSLNHLSLKGAVTGTDASVRFE